MSDPRIRFPNWARTGYSGTGPTGDKRVTPLVLWLRRPRERQLPPYGGRLTLKGDSQETIGQGVLLIHDFSALRQQIKFCQGLPLGNIEPKCVALSRQR